MAVVGECVGALPMYENGSVGLRSVSALSGSVLNDVVLFEDGRTPAGIVASPDGFTVAAATRDSASLISVDAASGDVWVPSIPDCGPKASLFGDSTLGMLARNAANGEVVAETRDVVTRALAGSATVAGNDAHLVAFSAVGDGYAVATQYTDGSLLAST